mmetsp:Transcript_29029/g.61601  ORF Transcript_29029/g.61601 Transcript_29029/m.61601 type:complete len:103 (-) Transcript_29029:589-897(-)
MAGERGVVRDSPLQFSNCRTWTMHPRPAKERGGENLPSRSGRAPSDVHFGSQPDIARPVVATAIIAPYHPIPMRRAEPSFSTPVSTPLLSNVIPGGALTFPT